MENRIEINGVWYVKESTDEKEPIELDPTQFEGLVVEDGDFCFEATRIFKDDGTPYSDCVSIKCTDKREKPWKEDDWDHTGWMRGVLKNNPESLEELPADMGKESIRFLQAFLQLLTDKEWL
jgi:hypothetical protein